MSKKFKSESAKAEQVRTIATRLKWFQELGFYSVPGNNPLEGNTGWFVGTNGWVNISINLSVSPIPHPITMTFESGKAQLYHGTFDPRLFIEILYLNSHDEKIKEIEEGVGRIIEAERKAQAERNFIEKYQTIELESDPAETTDQTARTGYAHVVGNEIPQPIPDDSSSLIGLE